MSPLEQNRGHGSDDGERLDLATVIKVSQAVSGEIVLEKLVGALMRTAIEQAGAERGLLILAHGPELRIAAEAVTGDAVIVHLHDVPVTAAAMPETVLHIVLRAEESVIFDDAAAALPFADDPYIREHRARSILCLPLVNQGKLIGVLYLENNLAPRAFTPARIAVLKLIASQAATSLENTRLYRELAEREAKIRGLLDANIIGMCVVAPDGRIIEANDAYLRIIGYDREDLLSGRLSWMDLTPVEWRDRSSQAISEFTATGFVQPFEKEYFRKDGSRAPVLVGLGNIEGREHQHVGFVLDLTERKRAEEALREREAKIRRLVDANIIGIFIWDFEGRIFEANDAFLHIVGYDREDLASGRLRWTALTPPEWGESDALLVQRQKETGSLPPFEKEYFRKDGSRVPVLIGTATFEERGDQGVAFVLDLTERKRAEQALRRSEAYIAEGQRLSKTGSWAYSPLTGITTYWSEEMFRIFGLDPHERMTDEKFWRLVHLEDRDRLREHVEREAREKREYVLNYRIVLADGTVTHIRDVGHPVVDAAGDLIEFVGTTVDVTERWHAEKALRESEEKWKAVFENNPTMYFMVDASGAILSVNPFGAQQLGFTVDELVGLPVQNLFHPEDREGVGKNIAICFERPGPTMNWEARKIRKSGEVVWVREMARVMLIKDRPVALIVCEDITERKRVGEALREMQMELAHANRVATMGQLTASIAHEVNQPIAASVTNAHAALRWLGAERPNLDEAKRALARIVENGNRAGAVISRIRALIEKAPPRNDRTAINDVIREVIELTRAETTKNGVSVRTQLADDLPTIGGDRVQLQQVILNLVVNAIEAMGGENKAPRELLLVTERTEPHGVYVAVQDTGPGLAPGAAERVFEAFYTNKPNGLGLGLSICRSIIEAHGGRLWATANEPRGAIFHFTAPAHSAD